jgi:hypothetical protein
LRRFLVVKASRFQIIASAVTAEPSWNLTPSRKEKSQRVWSSSSIFHEAAGPGVSLAISSGRVKSQPVECRKAEKAKTFAAIVWDPGGGRDVGGGHGDAQSLSKRRERCRSAEQERNGDESRGKLAQRGRASRWRRKPAFWRFFLP